MLRLLLLMGVHPIQLGFRTHRPRGLLCRLLPWTFDLTSPCSGVSVCKKGVRKQQTHVRPGLPERMRDTCRCLAHRACCLRVSFTVVKHHDRKQRGAERVHFSSHFSGHTPLLRESGQDLRQGRNQEAPTGAEAMECYCLLACSS